MFTVEKTTAEGGQRRRKDAVPDLHRQLRDEIIRAIVTGHYRVGERLPPIETMALEVEVSVHTVARVYRELAEEGVLNTNNAQQGTFVASPPEEVLFEYGDHLISPVIRELRRLRYAEDLIRRIVDQACKRWFIVRSDEPRRKKNAPVDADQRKTTTRRKKTAPKS